MIAKRQTSDEACRFCYQSGMLISDSPRASESLARELSVKFGKPLVQRVICVSLHPILLASSLWLMPSLLSIVSILSMMAQDQSISCFIAGDTFSNWLWNKLFRFIVGILCLQFSLALFLQLLRFRLQYLF